MLCLLPVVGAAAQLQAGGDWTPAPAALLEVREAAQNALPTVTAHGMGDSCFNGGMKQITQLIGAKLGTYAVCVPTGNRLTDTTNGLYLAPCSQTQSPLPLHAGLTLLPRIPVRSAS